MKRELNIINWPGSPHVQLILTNPHTNTSLNLQIAEGTYMDTKNLDINRVMQSFPDLSIYAYKSQKNIMKLGLPTDGPHIEEKRVPLSVRELFVLSQYYTPRVTDTLGEDKVEIATALKLFFKEETEYYREEVLKGHRRETIDMYYTRTLGSQFFFSVNMEVALKDLEGRQNRSNQERK